MVKVDYQLMYSYPVLTFIIRLVGTPAKVYHPEQTTARKGVYPEQTTARKGVYLEQTYAPNSVYPEQTSALCSG